MSKYSYEQKLNVVLNRLETHMSHKNAGVEFGVNRGQVMRWVGLYERFGPEGLMMKHETYSGVFKLSIIEYMHENYLSLRETAIHFGILQDSTVGKWKRIYYEEGPKALFRDKRGRKKFIVLTSLRYQRKLTQKPKKILLLKYNVFVWRMNT